MKYTSLLLLLLPLLVISTSSSGQKVTGKLKFEQGQVLKINMTVKRTIVQQAMGQAIDFTVDAAGIHSYKVTNTTDENSTLRHQVQQINFSFDGMGQKRSFNSREEKDMNGQFGKPIKELLEKKYDIILDTGGKTLMAVPEKIELSQGDSRMAIVTNMLSEMLDLVQPPAKGSASFFKILPDTVAGKGDTWTSSLQTNGGKTDAAYVISAITDSTILIDFVENSVTVTKAEMMGSETSTTMNNKSTGKIILDRLTGIIREKTISTESNGTTESSFGSLPVTSKTTTTISVKPLAE